MVAPISDDALVDIDVAVFILAYFLFALSGLFVYCCLPCCGITTCICYTRRNKSQTCLDKKVFRAAARLFWFLKKRKNQDNTSYFVILDKRAPVSYPYYLLVMTIMITINTIYTLMVNSLYIFRKEDTNNIEAGDSSKCETTDMNCVEIDLLGGLESAVTMFSMCVTTFAIITYCLLKCTSCCIDNTHCYSCKCCTYCFVILLQIVGFFIPKTVLYFFIFTGSRSSYLHYNSLFALSAIIDCIAYSMLTPWFLFVKDEAKNKGDDTRKYDLRMEGISNV